MKSELTMKFKVHPVFFVFWAVFALLGETEFILYIFLAAAFHETAHILAYTFFGAEIGEIELLPFGISATIKNATALSCKKEIICAAAGPFANIVLTSLYLLPNSIVFGADILTYCSLSLFLINILPILPLDGGRILWFILLLFLPYTKAKKISDCINTAVSSFIFTLGIIWGIEFGNISLFMIGAYLMIYTVFKS